jgi:2-polyprenyl-3-methyl-5-hydroxy-6-metoxy-1,4-benzoquinol methylase
MINHYCLSLSPYSTHGIITANIGDGRFVLDVGCNDGYIGGVSSASNAFFGLDYSADSVEKARIIYQDAIEYDLNSLRDLPWPVKFDLLIFADVLEHLADPEKVLRFFVEKYLRPGGEAIISLPNIANWQVRLGLLAGKFDSKETGVLDKTHWHFYTFKSARRLAEAAGLKIEKSLGGASFFGPLIKIFPSLGALLATNIILICKK